MRDDNRYRSSINLDPLENAIKLAEEAAAWLDHALVERNHDVGVGTIDRIAKLGQRFTTRAMDLES